MEVAFAALAEHIKPRDYSQRMKLTWRSHSAFRIEAGAAKMLIDPFLSDSPSWDKGWIGSSRADEDSTQGGGR
jgi:L-ascorbate metabolism protein UlaG (beta-lactamase superfamily)